MRNRKKRKREKERKKKEGEEGVQPQPDLDSAGAEQHGLAYKSLLCIVCLADMVDVVHRATKDLDDYSEQTDEGWLTVDSSLRLQVLKVALTSPFARPVGDCM